ncbi:tRNA (adenosine(37)-N6)-dimethylallyltransferase MiaA [Gemelliphila palaticanis]|uniref:tRNA dimethylallyltransferase n=1 Tax=Gemelliphila palaticanis TaxID=81950 RepID=A0ABX2SZM3_9BACL|nr:tRNA (adenosine(37)-N6)-dimethylallyltransferase MiaA [Gemella palaticanis]MBF0714867.1 tRNA (adenosine(37)-N6)-dimethylallyltransferase MiaA [Gemella palaticanis]NYS46797.1 tRNA (adenosine(37)-N6)-dimethylallyltransferase MiaA [Gemella palaticanis]
MKIPIIAIVGPTAVGKTEISIEIAKKFNCEIISVDSVQMYKHFNIGSAKITHEEMQGVTHHLIDNLNPDDKFSVYEYQKIAREKILEVIKKGKIPLLIGGTGYYMSAVLYDYTFSNYSSNNKENFSLEYMKNYLLENYPDTYNNIDINNERRVTNAYKYVTEENKSTIENNNANNLYDNYNPYIIVLKQDREVLYNRINLRVEKMIQLGLIAEVKNIIANYGGNLQPLTAIGYKEVVSYLNNEISEEYMIESIQQNSRRYAKRQITWFKNKMFNTNWYNLDIDNKSKIFEDIEKYLRENE